MTHLLKCRLNQSLLALAAFAALGPQAMQAQAPQRCFLGNAVMNGTYVMSGSGTVVGAGPVAIVGQVVYNGNGTGTLNVTKNVNGMVVSASVSVAYTVNPDCTGSKTVGSGASATHFDFVITPDGAAITWVGTDAAVVISGKAKRSSP